MRKKDASSIPFPIVISGTVVCFLWLLYSIILLNHFMFVSTPASPPYLSIAYLFFLQIQNVVGMVLCIIQVVLTIIYPGKAKIE